VRRAALVYTVGRFGLFGLVAIILWGAAGLLGKDLNGLPLLLLAALISSALGYVLFARQRQTLAEAIDGQRKAKAEQVAARRARIENES
jgi:cell division protein FtsL